MKDILVLTDFSRNALSAFIYITRLMKDTTCTFHLLNVYNEFVPPKKKTDQKPLIDQLRDESIEGLSAILNQINLKDHDSKHHVIMLSKQGELVEVLTKIVAEEVFDLVVMGNTGQSEIEAIFLGSNALDAVEIIKENALLTVPKGMEFKPPRNIAFVTDYKHNYDAKLLHPLLVIAKQYRSKIQIVHINEEEVLSEVQERNRSVLLQYLLPYEYSIHWMPMFRTKATAIHTFLDEMKIKMLAMVNYEHSFLERATREPVIKRMAFNLDIPFLIIPSSD